MKETLQAILILFEHDLKFSISFQVLFWLKNETFNSDVSSTTADYQRYEKLKLTDNNNDFFRWFLLIFSGFQVHR